jgi:2-keto-3-deoxy-L-rhamnonate aldolase RhmA
VKNNPVKTKLAAGEVAAGAFVMEFGTNGIGRIAGAAGAEFIVFDTEHTGWTAETVQRLVMGARLADIVPIVRVPAGYPHFLAQALDAGALGVMTPSVGTAREARQIVRACKYPPTGARGATFNFAHDDYLPGDTGDKARHANEHTLVIVQIETAEGLGNVEEIAAVDGVDVLWVGHNDLTASLGIAGQVTHPRYLGALDQVAAAARRHGKSAGFNAGSVRVAVDMIDRGFTAIAYGNDIRIFTEALRAGLAAISGHDRAGA